MNSYGYMFKERDLLMGPFFVCRGKITIKQNYLNPHSEINQLPKKSASAAILA